MISKVVYGGVWYGMVWCAKKKSSTFLIDNSGSEFQKQT